MRERAELKKMLAPHAMECGMIETRMLKFDALNNVIIEGAKSFSMAEYSKTELIIARNYEGVKACRLILKLNSDIKKETGDTILDKYYDISQVRFAQNDVSVLEDLMDDFENILYHITHEDSDDRSMTA